MRVNRTREAKGSHRYGCHLGEARGGRRGKWADNFEKQKSNSKPNPLLNESKAFCPRYSEICSRENSKKIIIRSYQNLRFAFDYADRWS